MPMLTCRQTFIGRQIMTHVKSPFNFIGGKRCSPAQHHRKIKVTEPATGHVLADVPVSGKADVDEAVSAAKAVFSEWKQFSGRERGRLLTRAAENIRKNIEDISRLEVLDNGKPIWEAQVDIASCADALEYFGGIAAGLSGRYIDVGRGSFVMVIKEPLGVIGGIGAWNFPMQTCVWKVAPALACGNTFVYKPSQFTPVTAVILGEILKEAGVPDGVYNVIQGDGETGQLLCTHPDVAKLSFTGSVPAGVKVMSSAAKGIKPVTLELGGKSPLIIFEDADQTNAVKAALMANFLSQGQVCSNGTRVFVHKHISDQFIKELVFQTKQLKIGDPMDETTTVGATIHEDQAKIVLSYIDSAREEGARLLCGGERVILEGRLAGGWYLSPAVLSNCHDEMKVVKEEVFGSVLCILEFETEEEVVRRANNTPFGLAGGVFTKNVSRAHQVAHGIEAGSIWINTYNLYPPEIPFGGFKSSGIGIENGTEVLDHCTQTKSIYFEAGDVDCGPLYTPQ